MDRLRIFDTTLRDGEQSPGASLTSDEKLEVALQLGELGVDIIEAGFPIASPDDAGAVRRIAKEVKGPVIAGLARCKPEDIDVAWEALRDGENVRLHTFISTSDIHLKHQFRMTREEALEQAVAMVRRAKSYVPDVSSLLWTLLGPIASTCTGCSKRSSPPALPRSTSPIPSASSRRSSSAR